MEQSFYLFYLGIRQPKAPSSINGLGLEFFHELSIVSKPMQHSRAAASNDRQDSYAAHNNNGKAHIWFTTSPDDTQSIKIMWFALGEDACNKFGLSAPSGTFRFDLVAKHSGAAALNFQNMLELVITHVIGWDLKKRRPYRRGGFFGVPKAWLRVVEEQGRLTLHAHFLVWIFGHDDIAIQINEAFETSQSSCIERPSLVNHPSSTSEQTVIFKCLYISIT